MLLVRTLLIASLAPLAHAEYREQLYSDQSSGLEITATSPLSTVPPYGYFPLHLRVRNNSPERRSWNINISPHGPFLHDDYQESFTADPMESKSIWLMIPLNHPPTNPFHFASMPLFLRMSGDVSDVGLAQIPGFSGTYPPSEISSLHTRIALFSETMNQLSGKFDSDYKENFHANFSGLPEFPVDWRGYSSLKSVWLQSTEWNELSEPQRQALLEWIFQGGHLHLASFAPDDTSKVETSPPPEKADNNNDKEKDKTKDEKRIAEIKLLESNSFEALPSDLRKRLGQPVYHGNNAGWQFGLGGIHQPMLPALTSPESVDTIVAHVDQVKSQSLFQRLFLPAPVQLIDPDTYSIKKVPGEYLLLIIVIYIIGLTFLTLKTLKKPAKRYSLFITIPIFSTLTCIGIILTIILADGVGGKGVQVVLAAIVPNGSHQALVIQDQTVKIGSLLAKNFSLPEDVAFSEIPGSCNSTERCNTTLNKNHRSFHSSRITFSGDYFTPRSVASHSFERFTFLRGGIELRRREDGSETTEAEIIEARSTLPVPVNRLWVALGGKQYAGTLNPEGQWSPINTNNVNEFLSNIPGLAHRSLPINTIESPLIRTLAHFNAPHAIQPDAWIAVSDNPSDIFLQTLPSIQWENRELILVGTTFDALDGLTDRKAL